MNLLSKEEKHIKIRDIEIKHYRIPLEPPLCATWDAQIRDSLTATIVQVHTDDGRTGIGSGDSMIGFDHFKHLFIGQEVEQIETHNSILSSISLAGARYWPLDIALWDLIGQEAGMPLYKLFGGATDKLPAYCSTGELHDPVRRASEVEQLRERGFRAVKIRAHHEDIRDDLEVIKKVRETVGSTMDIMVDANQAWRTPGDTRPYWELKTAVKFAQELEEYDVYWLEEPLYLDDYAGLAELRQSTSVRIAGGEFNRHASDFREYAAHRSVDIVQPDVVFCGGFTQGLKIAHLASLHGMHYSPHTWGNGIGLIANLHVAAGTGICPYIEFAFEPPAFTNEYRDFVLQTPNDIDKDGYLQLSDKPGLGIELREDIARFEI